MDVATGASDLPLSRERLSAGRFRRRSRLLILALAALGVALCDSAPALAIGENQPIHASADREIWDRKNNRAELYGHAVVQQPGETLMADKIILDQEARTLDAKGNCVYLASDSVIYGEEMHFNLDSRTGTIIGGRVSTDKFTLGGERINKLGEGRFQTHWGEYSTCKDCAQSWTLQAQDVDMEIEGYAHLSNVAVKIKDAPAMWLPYLIVPMKTRRQTGLLFPTFSISQQNGLTYVQPFFWAIDRSSDMTIGLGEYSAKGLRAQWEGRYALSDRSGGQANFFFLSDQTFADPAVTSPSLNPRGTKSRWAVDIAQTQELPFGIDQKLRLTEVSDNFYPTAIGDVPGGGEKDISSTLSFAYASSDLSAYVAAQRYRNLLDTNLDSDLGIRRFDPTTVQAYPKAAVTTNDRLLFGTPMATGLTLGVSHFTRASGPFDRDVFGATSGTEPGKDPLRIATRFSVAPSLYATARPWDVFSFTPSVKYFGYFYSFHNVVDNLYRSYVLLQADLSTQLEKVYAMENPDRPRRKHLIRPLLTYSYIPDSLRHEDPHPFLSQIEYAKANNAYGYNFDNLDIVPVERSPNDTDNYFVPLGHSLAYGVTTQLIERRGRVDDPTSSYFTPLEFSAGQAVNFREYGRTDPQPFTRLFATLRLNQEDRFITDTNYYYYPYESQRHQLTTSATYVLERSLRQRILNFDRSATLTYTWNPRRSTDNLVGAISFSVSDYVLPSINASYDFFKSRFLGAGINLAFQSPSQCWKLNLSRTYSISPTGGPKLDFGIDLAVNLTGTGFGGATEVLSQAVAPK